MPHYLLIDWIVVSVLDISGNHEMPEHLGAHFRQGLQIPVIEQRNDLIMSRRGVT